MYRRYCASFKSYSDSNLYLDDQFYGHCQHGAEYDPDICGTAPCNAYAYVCSDSNSLPDPDAYAYTDVIISAQKENY